MVWADSNYTYKKEITVTNTLVSGCVSDFPIYISSNSSDFSKCLSNGYDIKFYNQNETQKLSHEIERFKDDTLIAWVKVPRISSNASHSGNTLYMYYGYSDETIPQQIQSDVWSNDFVDVWHGASYSSQYMVSTSSFDPSIDYLQGVTTDGEYIYVAGKGTDYPGALKSFDLNYNAVSSNQLTEAAPSSLEQISSIFIKDDFIYVADINPNANNGVASHPHVVKFDKGLKYADGGSDPWDPADDVLYDETVTGYNTEGITYFNGYWWLSFGTAEGHLGITSGKGKIRRYDDSWTFVKEYKIPVFGAQGISFWKEGDIIYCGFTVHNNGSYYEQQGFHKFRYDEDSDKFIYLQWFSPHPTSEIMLDQGWDTFDHTDFKPGLSGCVFALRYKGDDTTRIDLVARGSVSSSCLASSNVSRLYDSVGKQHIPSSSGAPKSNVNSKIGYGMELAGTNVVPDDGYNLYTLRDDESYTDSYLNSGSQDFTLESWFNTDNVTAYQRLFVLYDTHGRSYAGVRGDLDGDPIRFAADFGSWTSRGIDISLTADKWYYFAGTYNRETVGISGICVYISGNLLGDRAPSSGTFDSDAANYLAIGYYSKDADEGFDGTLDELRISKCTRNAQWLKTTYNTIDNNNQFLTFGNEEINSTGYKLYTVGSGRLTSVGDGKLYIIKI